MFISKIIRFKAECIWNNNKNYRFFKKENNSILWKGRKIKDVKWSNSKQLWNSKRDSNINNDKLRKEEAKCCFEKVFSLWEYMIVLVYYLIVHHKKKKYRQNEARIDDDNDERKRDDQKNPRETLNFWNGKPKIKHHNQIQTKQRRRRQRRRERKNHH